ncbi:MAG: nucleoside kinase [Verrucomicrobia bacterium]|nr:nucleoside kinase [Verrucomicrobiota bacterium]MBU4292162.1 nucleoside kinase [Verrucomicrobiota bacterium]MBU4429436.1 nucleoside kinase [Verrucomicrobiota bacterium]MCG2681607.1 nucleoside kinase [Kiritimatiellia bacterium]
MSTITVKLDAGALLTCEAGTEAGALLPSRISPDGMPFIGCLANNDVSSLSYPLDVNSAVRFLTMRDPQGMRIYRNSISFLLSKAAATLFPRARFYIEHSLGTGYFCRFETGSRRSITPQQVQRMEDAMRRLVERNLPIRRQKLAFIEALSIFEKAGLIDKVNLLRFRNPPKIIIYECDGYIDLAHGPLAQNTGVLNVFQLIHYPPGLVLQFPDPDRLHRVVPFRDQPHLFQIFQEHKEWGRVLGVNNVGKLNELIAGGGIRNFIKVEEAFHEKKIASIADRIFTRRPRVRLVLIAGPSAAGKTTFSKRLAVELEGLGVRPVMISLDNYYKNDAQTPCDRSGHPDYEHIRAVDVELFNRHILRLIAGKEIDLPYFNFQKKRREYRGERLAISDDQVVIVEGIHGLNPRFTHRVPDRYTFRIYISALTQLNIDANNRISTTDNRLMRRLVRDHAYRGNSALATFRMWPSVRRGEKTWIFPYQNRADVTFNSALDYELAVLKPLIEPLLMEIKPLDPEYAEARRLQEFLSNFLEVLTAEVPSTSILREFIGASGFKY